MKTTSLKTKMKRLFRQMTDEDVRKLMTYGGHVGLEVGSREPILSFGINLGLAAVGHWAVAIPIEAKELHFPEELDPAPGGDPEDDDGDVYVYPARWTNAATRSTREWLLEQCEFWADNMAVQLVASEYIGLTFS